MKPYPQCHTNGFSHTASQDQSLSLFKSRLRTSEYPTSTNSWGSSFPTQPLAVFHYLHCWSNLNIPCCCLNPTYLPHYRHGKQIASSHYASVLQTSEDCYQLLYSQYSFFPLNHPCHSGFFPQHRISRPLTTGMVLLWILFHRSTFVLKSSLQNQMYVIAEDPLAMGGIDNRWSMSGHTSQCTSQSGIMSSSYHVPWHEVCIVTMTLTALSRLYGRDRVMILTAALCLACPAGERSKTCHSEGMKGRQSVPWTDFRRSWPGGPKVWVVFK